MPAPFPSETFEPTEWPHCLATIDVSALPRPTKFCDPDGYDIIPIRMIEVVQSSSEYTSSEDYSAELFSESEDDESNVFI